MDQSVMRYIPNGSQDVQEMLEEIGAASIADLFSSIPESVKLEGLLDLPGPWSEIEVRNWFRMLASRNVATHDRIALIGGGAYLHYQPACIDQLLLRGEFLTSYTPYQPEVSQGTLQAIFEYQTHQCMLTGLDVANASLYDGSTAFVEGVLLADRVSKGRRKVVVAKSIHPHYRETLECYVQNLGLEIVEIGWGADGRIDMDALSAACDSTVSSVSVQSPNFFGVIEDYDAVGKVAEAAGAQKIAVINEPTSLGILQTPGQHRFDMAVGEGQGWGVPPQFGGPYVGFMAVRDPLKRNMPGRLVGETVDADGRRAFVLTLATREQHIRRGKATSNICTNTALFALAANMYLSLMGKDGLREVAVQCIQKAAYLKKELEATGLVEFPFTAPVYNEFTVRSTRPATDVLQELSARGILGGIALSRYYSGMPNDFIVAVTELSSKEQLDRYVTELRTILGGTR